jgi:hypothetical protein
MKELVKKGISVPDAFNIYIGKKTRIAK